MNEFVDLEKDDFVDTVTQLIMSGVAEDISYRQIATDIWDYLIGLKIKVKP